MSATRENTRTLGKIGRYELIKEIGRGAHGVVYLGRDPLIGRELAIKTLSGIEKPLDYELKQQLLEEARIVAQLSHPAIVTLYDAGEQEGIPYVVLEYIRGGSLAERLRDKGALTPNRAATLMAPLLEAVSLAHSRGILHGDIKPANILMGSNDTPRLVDFGVSALIRSGAVAGTLNYLAPECYEGVIDARSEVFSLGLTFYELLSGRPAMTARSVAEARRSVETGAIPPLVDRNPQVGGRLSALVARAIRAIPDERYACVQDFRQALQEYLEPEVGPVATGPSQDTVEFLLRRMEHNGDFPALSSSVQAISGIISADSASVGALADSVLHDFALTNKILKLANTAFYGAFAGNITTVSRAIFLLGFETVRHLALSVMLLDSLSNRAKAEALKQELITVLFTGLSAREIAKQMGITPCEEAMVCGLMQNLGRMLVMFYLTDEFEEIEQRAGNRRLDEDKAARQVLGVGYDEIGIAVSKAWGLPDSIQASIRTFAPGPVPKPTKHADRLRVCAGLASDIAQIATDCAPEDKEKAVEALRKRYRDALPMTSAEVSDLISKSITDTKTHAGSLGLSALASRFLKEAKVNESSSASDVSTDPFLAKIIVQPASSVEPDATGQPDVPAGGKPGNADVVLSSGIQEVASALADDCSLNDVLRIVVETMYRGMGFDRALICIRDPKAGVMRALFGFGNDIGNVIPRFRWPIAHHPDVFHTVIDKQVDIHIADTQDDTALKWIPSWFRNAVPAKSFVLLPIMVNGKALGLLYGDRDGTDVDGLHPKELNLLRTLSSQAALAIKQKQRR